MRITEMVAIGLFFVLSVALACPQGALGRNMVPPEQEPTAPKPETTSPAQEQKPPEQKPAEQKVDDDDKEGKQTNRMFGIVPNFAAVSANTKLPPLTTRGKFKLATEDSVDYSSFIWAGMLAGQSMALKTYPEFHQGIAGYGRYYWRAFADQASGAFFTEAIVPSIRHEDPRYYTLGHGGFFHRAGYALSRVVVTKRDNGELGFNYSETVGNALEAGLSNAYYPPEERSFHNTAVNWASQLEAASLNNLVREFWPDIRQKVLRQK